MLDLTGLDNLAATSVNEKDNGKPLELSLAKIMEDPDQPRQFFSEEAMQSLAASIKAKGVKTPISVKTLNGGDKYVINHGARRYRASLLAGLRTIPAYIDETHDDWDQIIENIERENLTPMEIALFIHKRVKAGDKKADIAANLGQKASFVSEHLSLINAPGFLQDLARSTQVGTKTLYLMLKGYEKYPEEVRAYATSEEVNRSGVLALLERLKKSVLPNSMPCGEADEQIVDHQDAGINALGDSPLGGGETGENGNPESAPSSESMRPTRIAGPLLNPQRGVEKKKGASREQKNESGKEPEPRKPSILLKVGERLGILAMVGQVTVVYEDSGDTVEVDLSTVEILEVRR
ncbi:MAG: ParB/RepB/Spo0J family partition protein [Syntrophobacteraceae bacterium]